MKKQVRQYLKTVSLAIPPSIEEYDKIVSIKGSELIASGVSEVEGDPVEPRKEYRRNVNRIRPLNHLRRLKKFYTKYGADDFLGEYIKWLRPHHYKMMKKYPYQFKQLKRGLKDELIK